MLWWNGSLQRLLAGDVTGWIAVSIALRIGAWIVHRELPSRDEAAEALLEEMQVGQ